MASFLNNVGINLNPFSTRVGQKIEEATDSSYASENWEAIMEVCDIINGTEDGPKDAIKAIKKRLQQNAGKNYKTVLYTLTLLEACVKNCEGKFRVLVCSKDFVQELVKLIGPKNEPPTEVQDKVLSLIQSWADAFRHQPEMSPVVQMYKDLKSKGIEFPMTDLDAMVPIHTPHKSVPSANEMSRQKKIQAVSSRQSSREGNYGGEGNLRLNPDQTAKLRRELDIVQENMSVLNEMLTELTPGKEHPSDLELLSQLYNTCQAMQKRLVELISQLSNDEVTAELLRINDLLNNLFLRYSRYEKNRNATSQGNGVAEKETASLIDLSEDTTDRKDGPDLINNFASLSVNKNNGVVNAYPSSSTSKVTGEKLTKNDSDFDMFAQSRNVTYETSKREGSTYEDNLKPDQVRGGIAAVAQSRSQPTSMDPDVIRMHRESDFAEMEAWLGEQPISIETDSLTSSEFDRFLAERAAAAESLPGEQTSTSSPSRSTTTVSHRNNKQPTKDMFAL